ncbi:hypothetical protein lerEdw1_002441 [Lerista edwardsae]|nr:hypothetical protein lerEdw1_002441 [Lerista edwardsae]
MEVLLSVLLNVLGFWFAAAFLLIVLPSVFGVSLGISQLYIRVLVKTLEWATLRIEKGIRRQQTEAVKNHVSNVIIQRDQTTMEKAIAGLRHGDFELSDVFYFCKKGLEAIVEDEVTQRFTSEELVSWNLLTRTNINFHYISLRLTVVWVIGVFVRYCFLLPLRITLMTIGIISMIVGTTLVGQLPNGEMKGWLSDLVHLTCSRILVRSVSGTIYYHNKENKPKKGGICVANHTSPIDVIILTNDGCYAMEFLLILICLFWGGDDLQVGQSHGGLMGVIQRATVKACPHVWFERSEMKDRQIVTKRLQEHVADKSKLPILIFPEGTCINNTSVMMFKKGSFEIGGTIYPVAIKYDPQFGDAFWNSSKHGIVSYLLRIMTSWAIVCHVWYMPPMTREEGENAVQFADRVKSAIARQGGLTELPWDGGLKRAKVKDTFKEEEQKNYSKMIIGNGASSSSSTDLD